MNNDTTDEIQGQFPVLGVTQEVGSTYGESFALNRKTPILQFLHGNSERISFEGRLYAETAVDDLYKHIKLLLSWAERDEDLKRPPVLGFWVGNASLSLNCILESVSNIVYHSFRDDGSPRDITFTLNLREYVPYSLEIESGGETRYHRAKLHDYYEWLTQREYRDPMLGVYIRGQHPTKPSLAVGDVVKLPSIDSLRTVKVQPSSISLKTSFGRKDTVQRTLRILVQDRLNVSYVSHVLARH
jgi:hypothetical protein